MKKITASPVKRRAVERAFALFFAMRGFAIEAPYLCKRRYFFLATPFCFGETKERFLVETIAFG